MISPYPEIDASGWTAYRDEPMGSKAKIWLLNGTERWLFKIPRQPGEDWSEKIAAEIAGLLGMPSARIELAVRSRQIGVVSKDFLTDPVAVQLVHGNELMAKLYADYQPTGNNWRLPQHTVSRVLRVLEQEYIHLPQFSGLPRPITNAPELFVGYLMFDALVGNTDRHHENWAIVDYQKSVGGQRYAELAPTFDHASCLGRELTDQVRRERLTTKDRNRTVQAYIDRMPSRLHRDEKTVKPLHPAEAFQMAVDSYPDAAKAWLQHLASIDSRTLREIIDAVPLARMSEKSRQFASRLLELNRESLLERFA